jgi:CBS domain-containing protein
MAAHKIGAVPIVERDELVGIITETDLLRAFINDCEPEH